MKHRDNLYARLNFDGVFSYPLDIIACQVTRSAQDVRTRLKQEIEKQTLLTYVIPHLRN